VSRIPASEETPRIPPPKGGRRYRMTIAYDGTDFYGWQAQPNKSTVQGALESALLQLTHETVRIHSCGRTDTGVHARAQVAHFDLKRPWEARHLQKGLNAFLPDSVRVPELRRTRSDFHARYNATGKEYRFSIWNAPVASPLHRRQALHVSHPLNLDAMRRAAALLEGQHDFSSFSANSRRKIRTMVRTLWRLSVRKQGSMVTISVLGDGFLYKMVRSLAGHLIRVGMGAIPVEETAVLLARQERTAHVKTAQPHGLCLWKIHYGGIPGLPKDAGL